MPSCANHALLMQDPGDPPPRNNAMLMQEKKKEGKKETKHLSPLIYIIRDIHVGISHVRSLILCVDATKFINILLPDGRRRFIVIIIITTTSLKITITSTIARGRGMGAAVRRFDTAERVVGHPSEIKDAYARDIVRVIDELPNQ